MSKKFVFFSLMNNCSMEGGELFQRIQDRQDAGPFTERGNLLRLTNDARICERGLNEPIF